MERPGTSFTIASSLDYWEEDEYWEDEDHAPPAETHAIFWKFGLLEFPDCVVSPNSLTFLDCRYNKIKNLPDDLSCISLVQHLDLTGNLIGGLPKTLGSLTCLRGLFLANNRILALPDSFGDLPFLEAARLDHNMLADLPYQVASWAWFRILLCSNCIKT
jgi:Leucine-rich repeat (LRR) protein